MDWADEIAYGLTASEWLIKDHATRTRRVADALLAERKRCAEVADKYAQDDLLHGEARLTAAYIRREIGGA